MKKFWNKKNNKSQDDVIELSTNKVGAFFYKLHQSKS